MYKLHPYVHTKMLPLALGIAGLSGCSDSPMGTWDIDNGVPTPVGAPSYFKATPTGTEDYFGSHIAIDDDLLVVSAVGEKSSGKCGDNTDIYMSGAVYVFRDPDRDGDFTNAVQEACLKAPIPAVEDTFGRSVAINDDRIVVGAPLKTIDSAEITGARIIYGGAAYVFAYNGQDWVEEAHLTIDNARPGDYFGVSVAIDENRVVVGAVGHGDAEFLPNPGAAFVFTYDGSRWLQTAQLSSGDISSYTEFGANVGIAGDRIFVASLARLPGNVRQVADPTKSGAIHVFAYDDTSWTEQARLEASNGQCNDAFGMAMDIDGDRVIVSAPVADRDDPQVERDVGAAHIFAYNGDTWLEQAHLTASNGESGDLFGRAVAISGDLALVSAELEAGSGSSPDDNSLEDAGAVYVFTYDGDRWIETDYIKSDNVDAGDFFGAAIAMDGSQIVVGAPGEDGSGLLPIDNSTDEAGAVYIFRAAAPVIIE